MTQRYDIKTIYRQALEGLHNPYTARAGVLTETAGNTLLFVGGIFVANFRGHLPAGNGIGRAHGLA